MSTYVDAVGNTVTRPRRTRVEWRISGYALIQRHERILVVVPTWNDQFELPGGGIEEKEKVKQGIAREYYEETGYQITLTDRLPVYLSEENFYHRPFKKFYHSLIVVYRGELRSSKQNRSVVNTRDGYEIKKIVWKKIADFNQRNTHRIIYPLIRQLQV